MVAVIGYPGESKHTWERFDNRADALVWLKTTGDELYAENPVWPAALSSQRIISEREAAKERYRDGCKVYPTNREYA